MRFLISIGLFLASSSGAYPQHRAGFTPLGPTVVRTGPLISVRPPVASWGGRPPTAVRPPNAWWRCGRFNHSGGDIIPYVVPYPVYFNGGYYPGYSNSGPYPDIPYPYEQEFPPVMAGSLTQQPAPPVIINQYVPEPGPTRPAQNSTVQVYQAPTSPRPEPAEPLRPMIFIALKDGWVYTASDYGVERGTLHYITTQGKHSQVSLDLVDREKSARLNSGREFSLPPP
jgi:hypothetical protein